LDEYRSWIVRKEEREWVNKDFKRRKESCERQGKVEVNSAVNAVNIEAEFLIC